MNNNKNIDFRFQTDSFEIRKAKDKDGNEVMRIGGIASKEEEDSQGETLLIEGMDVSSRMINSFLNWNHGRGAGDIIGQITKAEKRGKELYIEADLFPEIPLAKDTYRLTKILEKRNSPKRMSFSIEGKAIERNPLNPKIVTKSILTGCAATVQPINRSTLAQIIKGETDGLQEPEYNIIKSDNKNLIVDVTDENGDRITIDESYNVDIKKAMSSESAPELEPESLDKEEKNLEYSKKKKKNKDKNFSLQDKNDNFTKKLKKSDIYDYFFKSIKDLSVGNAKRLYQVIEVLQKSQGDTMEDITEQELEKAFATLKSVANNSEEIKKGVAESAQSGSKEGGEFSMVGFMKSCVEKGMEKEEIMKAAKEKDESMSDEEMDKMYESEFGKKKEEPKKEEKEMKKSEEAELSVEDKIAKAESELEALKAVKEAELKKSEEPTPDTIEKGEVDLIKGAISDLEKGFNDKFSALADILKGVVEENESVKTLLSTKEEELNKSEEKYNALANEANKPKSITTQSYIEKGGSNNQLGGQSVLDSSTPEGRRAIIQKGDSMINWDNPDDKAFAKAIDNFAYGTAGLSGVIVDKFNKNGIAVR